MALAPAALAADLGTFRQASIKDAPVYEPAFTWTGFYVGAQVGHGWGETEFSDCCGKWGFDQDGWFGGGFIGFNWQKDRFVFGIEGDANAADIERSEFFYGDKYSSTIDALYSIRGRAGFAHDNWLIFATGGWAWANVEDSCTSVAGQVLRGRYRRRLDLGGGVEYATPNWTARVVPSYDFDESKLPSWGAGYKRELDIDTISVGIAYKF